jgi:Dolichyl-phosphate-mannose-protein mannosyltransferase
VIPETQIYGERIGGGHSAAAPRLRLRQFAVAHPAAAWLAGLMTLSAVLRFALAYWMPAPWIFADELIYSELGKSFASSGSFAIRDVHGLGFGPLYPLLISPMYAMFESVPHAYLAIKVMNSLVMSLAAVPTYFLARRLVSRGWAVVAASLALAVPSMAYTGMVMTENLFYPLFLTALLLIVRMFEQPSSRRQLVALGVIALGLLTRSQAVALVPALLTAILAVSVGDAIADGFRPRPTVLFRWLGAYLPTLLTLGVGLVALTAWEAAHGRSIFASFGTAEGVWHQSYSAAAVGRWFVYHLAELDLYAGVLPFAAFVILASFSFSRADRSMRVFAAVAVSAMFWLLLTVSAFISNVAKYDAHSSSRIMDRYTFYLMPVLLIALLAWVTQRVNRPAWTTAAVGIVAGALPLVVPYRTYIRADAIPDTFGLMTWAVTRGDRLAAPSHIVAQIGLITLALGALFFLLRRPRLSRIAPFLVLLNFIAVMAGAQIRAHGASAFAAQSIQPDRAWIDEAIGPKAEAVAIWSGNGDPHLIWENEFFNRSVGQIYYLRRPSWQGLPEQRLKADTAGRLHPEGSRVALRARYVLADSSLRLRGRIITVDRRSGMRLYRIAGGAAGPVRLRRE